MSLLWQSAGTAQRAQENQSGDRWADTHRPETPEWAQVTCDLRMGT